MELAQIKAEAFKWATARYVRSDAFIESHYKPASKEPCHQAGQKKQGRSRRSIAESILRSYGCSEGTNEVPVVAVARVRGVQLTPVSANKCAIKFDFAYSANPHADPPTSEATAERYETPTGHYWVIH